MINSDKYLAVVLKPDIILCMLLYTEIVITKPTSQTCDCNDDSNNMITVAFIVLFVISFVANILFTIVVTYGVAKIRKTSYSPSDA